MLEALSAYGALCTIVVTTAGIMSYTSVNSGNPCSCHSISEVTYRSVDGCSLPADGCSVQQAAARLL